MLVIVNREAVSPNDLEKEVISRSDGSCTDMTETTPGIDQRDQDWGDVYEAALQKALYTTRFEGLRDSRNTVLFTTQLATSTVISTIVTAFAYQAARPTHDMLSTTRLAAPGRTHKPRETVYGAPKSLSARSMKSRGARPHQAHLSVFRRNLPALSIPAKRLHRELLLERDAFMAQLVREREEKTLREGWAATRIQACFRGYRSRPRVVAYVRRMRKHALQSVSAIRLDLSDMEENLRMRGILLKESEFYRQWRQGSMDRALRKRGILNRQKECDHAVICVQSCIRRFLARTAYRCLVARARDERQMLAVVQIQRIFRGYYLRTWIHRLVIKVRQRAAVQIQALVRGSQARERVAMLQFERNCEERRRAGLPFQKTVHVFNNLSSSLKVLYENRKSRTFLDFKSTKWHEERRFLQIYNIFQRLAARRARLLHRWNWTRKVVLDKRRQRRVKKVVSVWSTLPFEKNRGATPGKARR